MDRAMHWTRLLESAIGRPCWDRPLVCDGLPDNSRVIIIGENPATEMENDWWTYWKPESGFDRTAFMRDYQEQRRRKNKRPLSNTRLRLEWIRENGVAGVETNAYCNERPGGAGNGVGNYAVLDLLIRNMPQLVAVIAHGNVAKAFAAGYQFPSNVKELFELRHFRMESRAEINRICAEIKAMG